ncbi:MAG: hypothetical protein H6766_05555 [Candidatus Peribacteria bacterium]|nr:MAG: hypothetical protein H6766_05555 [Candidatus Peribacteria bacterium]
MKSLQKTLLIAGGTVIGIAVAGGMFAYQDGKIGAFSDDTVQAALEANDYSALSTEAQAQITEDQFADMEAHQASREAIQTAIANRDYEAFLAAADDRMLERIDSEEAFNELVTREAAQTTYQSALEAAVVANDYDAYIAAEDALHEAMQPSDEDKQARFQELVTYYEENGALPQGR